MRKLLLVITIAILTISAFTGCNNKLRYQDIKLSDLQTPCDFIDAALIAFKDIKTIVGDKKSKEDLTQEEKELIEKIEEKGQQIKEEYRKRNFNNAHSDISNCPNYTKYQALGEMLDGIILWRS